MENICSVCDKSFTALKNLRQHVRNLHKDVNLEEIAPSKKANREYNFSCKLCCRNFSKESALKFHFKTCGNIEKEDSSIEILSFNSYQDFLAWKSQTEKSTHAQYIKKRTYVNEKEDHTTHYFSCHRSGVYKPTGESIRHLKTQGSCKIGETCPAAIKVQISHDKTCKVSFNSQHSGHNLHSPEDLAHLGLTKDEKLAIANDIRNNIPFHSVLDKIRYSLFDDGLERIHLLDMKDLHNIVQEFNLDADIRHKDDGTSVDLWVSEMGDLESSCVVFYKPQGTISAIYPNIDADDFLLVIMNEAQRHILTQYGKDVICMDGTHGTNAYNFELTTVLVLDELRQGFPCAFFITNKTDSMTLAVCLEQLKLKTGLIHCSVFMSDMAPALYNAWISTMDKPEKRLYCSWHVDRAWRVNIQKKVKRKEKQIEAYKMMRTILQIMEIEEFNKMFEGTVKYFADDEELSGFGYYITETYKENVSAWAYCHRLYAGINTNMHIERMHRSIKYIYLNGKKSKRLDKTIGALMTFIRDRLYSRVIELTKGKISSKVSEIRKSHSLSLLSKCQVKKLDNVQKWEIKENSKIYTVQEVNINCSCKLVCTECQVCIHQYLCSCYTSSIKWNMCKHIHLLAKSLNSDIGEDKIVSRAHGGALEDILPSLVSENVSDNISDQVDKLKGDILSMLDSVKTVDEVEYFSKNFSRMRSDLKTLEPRKNLNILSGKVCKKRNISPQRRLFSTKRKALKKKQKDGPTQLETEKIKNDLVLSFL